MIDKEIRKDNKIPGCDRMTRPEEISALSKFLGHVREVQDEHTHLSLGVDGLPFRNDGRNMPEIDELDDRLYVINPEAKEHDKQIELIHDPHLRPEGIPGADPDLTTRYSIPKGEPKEEIIKPVDIEERWKIPGDHKASSLVLDKDGVLRIPTPSKPSSLNELEDGVEKIPGTKKEPEKLEEGKEELRIQSPVSKLPQDSASLPGSSTDVPKNLEREKEEIPGNVPTLESLPEEKEILRGEEKVDSLSKTSLEIPGEDLQILSGLGEGNEKLPKGNRDGISLETLKDRIPGTQPEINALGEGREERPGEEEELKTLSGTISEIPGTISDPETLYSQVLGIPEADTILLTLPVDVERRPEGEGDVSGLEEGKEKRPGDDPEFSTLPDSFATIPGTIESPTQLPTDRSSIPTSLTTDNERLELEDERERVPGETADSNLSLPSESSPMPDSYGRSEITNLEETVVKIEGWKEPVESLRASVERVIESKNPDYIGEGWNGTLRKDADKVPDSQGADIPNSLPDSFEDIPGSFNDPSSLPDSFATIPSGENPDITNLPGSFEGLPNNIGGEVKGLPEDVVSIPDFSDSLSDLPEGREGIPGVTDVVPDNLPGEESREKIENFHDPVGDSLPDTIDEFIPGGDNDLIYELPDDYEQLPEGTEDEITSLPDTAYTLPEDTADRDIILSMLREGRPEGDSDIGGLYDTALARPDGEEEEIKSLPDGAEKRPEGLDPELSSLPDSFESRPEGTEPEISELSGTSETRPGGEDPEITTLPDSREIIPEGTPEISELPEDLETIPNEEPEISELPESRISRPEGEPDITDLPDTKETRPENDPEITTLPDSREIIPDGTPEITDLSSYREGLEEIEDKVEDLSGYIELRPELDPEITSLSDFLETRPEEDPEVESLSDYLEERPEDDPEITSLYDTSLQRPDWDPKSGGEPEELHSTALQRPGEDIEISELPDSPPPEILPQKEEEVEKRNEEMELWSETEALPENDPDNKLPEDKKTIESLGEVIEEVGKLEAEEKVEDLEGEIQGYVKRGESEHPEVESLWDSVENLETEGHVEAPIEDLDTEPREGLAGKEVKEELEEGKIELPEGRFEKTIEALTEVLEKENLTKLQLFKEFLEKTKELWNEKVGRPEGRVEREADPTEVYRETLFPNFNEGWFPNDFSEALGELKSEPELYDAVIQIVANQRKDWFPNNDFTDVEPTSQELYLACLQLLENKHPEISELSDLKEKLFNSLSVEVSEYVAKDRLTEYYKDYKWDSDREIPNQDTLETVNDQVESFAKSLSSPSQLPEDQPKPDPNENTEIVRNYSKIIEKFRSGNFKENHKLLLEVLKNENSEWANKIMSQLSTIAGSEIEKQDPKALEHYQHFLYKEGELLGLYDNSDNKIQNLDYPKYKLPHFTLDSVNPNNYLRWVAEEMIGTSIKGQARQILLNETLALLCLARDLLEDTAGTSRNRLPGDSGLLQDTLGGLMQDGVKGAVKSLGNGLKNAIFHDNSSPKNRPNKMGITTGWENINNIDSKGNTGGIGSSAIQNISLLGTVAGAAGGGDYSFSDNYLGGAGIGITLEELCNNTSVKTVSSVEDLFQAIKNSPFMASSEKVTSGPNRYVVSTLDSNAFWEITLEPYLGKSNGYMSYLPALNEMNTRNIKVHGVNTQYNRYIPAVSFDLQKSKMTTKTLGLYDGEISYPVSMELMNEFRITLIDDQYKSWKNYFETAAEVSVYSSVPHYKSYYEAGGVNSVTMADQQHVIVSNYKNVTWRCKIYCMTPQLSTTRRYDLLLVIKDMVEEYSGELEGAAQDLTVTFSIVGENPGDAQEIPIDTSISPGNPRELMEEDLVGSMMESVIDKGISSVLKLI